MDIHSLFKEDQKNIRLYKQNKISAKELRIRNKTISDKFLRILKEKGFPCKKGNVRTKEYQSAVVLTLHQPIRKIKKIYNELKTKGYCLDKKDEAYLIDKIRIRERKRQIYGTQYKILNDRIKFLPIKNRKQVDKLRKEMGLETLKKYKEIAEKNIK